MSASKKLLKRRKVGSIMKKLRPEIESILTKSK